MDTRETHQRSWSPRRRRQKRSCSLSDNSSSHSDTSSHFSRRNRRSGSHNVQSRNRRRSIRRSTRTDDHRRCHARSSSVIDSQDICLQDDSFSKTKVRLVQKLCHVKVYTKLIFCMWCSVLSIQETNTMTVKLETLMILNLPRVIDALHRMHLHLGPLCLALLDREIEWTNANEHEPRRNSNTSMPQQRHCRRFQLIRL